MGLFKKSLRGKFPDQIGGDTDQQYSQHQDSSEKRRIFGHDSSGEA